MALRIAVNSELDILQETLPDAFELLTEGGRLAVISFHSGEDRIVKLLFRKWESEGSGKIITKKPILPTKYEITSNPKSRSAKLRVIEKT
jgi:16S rRNA (cytosine1402-N4)-methyltransferase